MTQNKVEFETLLIYHPWAPSSIVDDLRRIFPNVLYYPVQPVKPVTEDTQLPSDENYPAEVKEIKTFLEYARRKDARQVSIKKTLAKKAGTDKLVQKTKFRLRCSKYLYTFQLSDSDKAEKIRQSLPPTLKVVDVDAPVKAKK
ncbi:60S ribosomal protein L38 [Rhodosporidiobolus nylandii]